MRRPTETKQRRRRRTTKEVRESGALCTPAARLGHRRQPGKRPPQLLRRHARNYKSNTSDSTLHFVSPSETKRRGQRANSANVAHPSGAEGDATWAREHFTRVPEPITISTRCHGTAAACALSQSPDSAMPVQVRPLSVLHGSGNTECRHVVSLPPMLGSIRQDEAVPWANGLLAAQVIVVGCWGRVACWPFTQRRGLHSHGSE